ncbi:hypothetical protein AB0K00_53255 [Dactylosporangium sp. NPDC049525]|uniref:hypothetical protein n=1 Tax=Dactylosporangium sp. NPDC049525 TaxID=3154730 RepID=UPI003447CA54
MKAEQFITSAQEHGHDSFRAHHLGRARATALHLGVMLEHLAKAYLFQQNPLYVVDGKSFDSMLALGGHAKHVNPDLKVRTIGAKEALKRFADLNPSFQVTGDLHLVIDARDGAAHAGNRAKDVEKLLFAALRAAQTMLNSIGHDEAAFWADYTGTVTAILTSHTDQLRTAVQLRIDQATRDHKERFGQLDERTKETFTAAFDAAVETASTAVGEDSTRAVCPACSHTGLLSGRSDISWDLGDDSDDHTKYYYPRLILYPSKFRCLRCRLHLAEDELAVVPGLADRQVVRELEFDEAVDLEAERRALKDR